MEEKQLQMILEAALLASPDPLSCEKMQALFAEEPVPTVADIKHVINDMMQHYQDRGFFLKEVASGYCFQVQQSLSPWISRLWEERPARYTRAFLETLVIIAYRQPVTRADIEDIRGVAVSTTIMKTLLEREWIKIVGQRDVPGKPNIYGTTKTFLDYFNLTSLTELPTLQDIKDLDKMASLFEGEFTLALSPEDGLSDVIEEPRESLRQDEVVETEELETMEESV